MTPRRVLCLVWLAFLARGLFYCVQQPMWEGYDEWAHFAYIQHIVERGRLPERSDMVSKEIQASLRLTPSPYGLQDFKLPLTTHDDYWRLPLAERLARKRSLDTMPASLRNQPDDSLRLYEGQQPPLYYLMLSFPYRLIRNASLPTRVQALRVLSMLIASLIVPLGYRAARQIFGRERTAVMIAMLVSVMPGFLIDVCRVGNECLAVVLISALMLTTLRLVRRDVSWRMWALAGVLLGAGLLTKAYVLAFIPLLMVVALIRALRLGGAKRSIAGMILALSMAMVIAGPWYGRTLQKTGTLSGEQVDVAAARFTVAEKLAAIGKVDWVVAVDELAYSHIWIGGWSFSSVRSWMYRVFELIAVAGALGFLRLCGRVVARSWRRRTVGLFSAELAIIGSAYLLFCAALAYDVVINFLAKGIPATCGWYLYAVMVPEFAIIALGIATLAGGNWFRWAAAVGSLIGAALDLYTVHFILVPYYTGVIAHRSSGVLNTFRLVDLQYAGVWEMFRRLSANGPSAIGPTLVVFLWAAYLCATVGIVAGAFALSATTRPGQRFMPACVRSRATVAGSPRSDLKTRLYAGWARAVWA